MQVKHWYTLLYRCLAKSIEPKMPELSEEFMLNMNGLFVHPGVVRAAYWGRCCNYLLDVTILPLSETYYCCHMKWSVGSVGYPVLHIMILWTFMLDVEQDCQPCLWFPCRVQVWNVLCLVPWYSTGYFYCCLFRRDIFFKVITGAKGFFGTWSLFIT